MTRAHPLVLGHRGASASHPENSLAAFQAALDLGADGVELDVRRTADEGLAVHHDARLPDSRAIMDLAMADLPEPVTTLEPALEVCRGAAIVNVEIKNLPDDIDFDPTEQLAHQVVALLDARGELADGRILVSCFHLPTIDRVHALAPELATAWLVLDAREPNPLIERAAAHGHAAIHPHHLFVNPAFVEKAGAAGLAVNTWTVDDPDRIRWLAEVGVDGIVTNDPAAALRALGR